MVLQAEARIIVSDPRTGASLSPAGMFDLFYMPLEPMIGVNRARAMRYREATLQDQSAAPGAPPASPYDTSLAVKVIKGDETTEYTARPRTNFDSTSPKRPNIVMLESQCGTKAILREARTYDPKSVQILRFKHKYGNSFNADGYLRTIQGRKRNFVPEPVLIQLLKTLTGERKAELGLESGGFTPDITVVEDSGNSVFYTRPFLQHAEDTHANMGDIGCYLGLLHSLGFLDNMDRQPAHYAYQFGPTGRRVVNFDPDFLTFTRVKESLNEDVGGFIEEVIKGNIEQRGIFPTATNGTLQKLRSSRASIVSRHFDSRSSVVEEVLNEALAARYASAEA